MGEGSSIRPESTVLHTKRSRYTSKSVEETGDSTSGKSTELTEAGVVDPATRDHHVVRIQGETVPPSGREVAGYLHRGGEHGGEETRLTGGRKLPDTGEIERSLL